MASFVVCMTIAAFFVPSDSLAQVKWLGFAACNALAALLVKED